MIYSLKYWFWFGTIYLIYMTYQDFTNNMNIDDRRNAVMLGLSLSVISHVPTSLWYKLSLTAILMLLNLLFKKLKVIGQADNNTLGWVFLGLGLMHVTYLVFFSIIFVSLTLVWVFIKTVIFKNKEQAQFYPVLLISFVLTAFLLGGY